MNNYGTPFTIMVDVPCTENWHKMEPAKQGRFCLQCKKQVADFSMLSDQELQDYLRKTAIIPCGRFHPAQLNRMIGRPAKTTIKPRIVLPGTAAVLVLFSLQLQAATNDIKPTAQHSFFFNQSYCDLPGDTLRISGTVRDQQHKPLENAEIVFNNELVGHTDKEGHFSFVLPDLPSIGVRHIRIVAGYPGLNNAVRNYHPAMGSTSYEFILYDPAGDDSFYIMGVPRIENRIVPLLLAFKKNEGKVKADTRAALGELAMQMRNSPFVRVTLLLSGKGANDVSSRKFSKEIKRILTEDEGIAEERLEEAINTDPAQKTFTLLIRQEVKE
jgi:hypothetical protein